MIRLRYGRRSRVRDAAAASSVLKPSRSFSSSLCRFVASDFFGLLLMLERRRLIGDVATLRALIRKQPAT
jgi:hypothetical protein